MKLEHILPRALGTDGSDCASIFTSLIMAAHFERTRARSLGWRGVRSSASEHPAWTCRIAGSDHIFGIRFDGEELSAHLNNNSSRILRGRFGLFLFPHAKSPLLDLFPLSALQFALSPNYTDAVRDFTGNEAFFNPFRLAELRLDVAFSGDSLAFTLEAPARRKIISADGVKTKDGWLIQPGDAECNLPIFSLFLRLFSVIAATAEQHTGEKSRVARGLYPIPRLCIRNTGTPEEYPGEHEFMLNITAAFGDSMAMPHEAVFPLKKLPLRHKPEETELHSRPILHVLTGFLGAGKTTFLRRWLDFLHGRERYTGVIQNEFGKVELDAALMKNDTIVEALNEGCVCCSLADSLRPGIERIIAAMPAEQFVLETTGLANPANITEALNDLRDLVIPGLVITVADALDLSTAETVGNEAKKSFSQEDSSGIRHAQILKADVIILNKSDMVSSEELERITNCLYAVNNKALILPARYGNIPFAELDAWIDENTERRLPSHRPSLLNMTEAAAARSTHENEGYISKTLEFEGAVSRTDLEAVLHDAGPGLCRAKGIIDIDGEGICIVQYAAGRLEITPAPDADILNLVLIGTALKI